MKLAIIIPAFNEEKSIGKVIKSIPKKIDGINNKTIFVIDDGSSDNTGEVARKSGATVLTHILNQGVGAATITGLEAAKIISSDIILTLDADGQHDSKEIKNIVKLILSKKYDVVIGSRLINRRKMPLLKNIGNNIMNWFTFALYDLWVKDSQSGFKGFSKKAINKMELTSGGYEICSEMIGEIKRSKLRYFELPIKTIYTKYSNKKGQFSLNAVNIIIRLIVKIFTG